jgi:2'-5' RNA ligase
MKSFKVTLKGCYNFDSPKILFLKPDKLDELRKLHNELLDLIEDFKDPWVRDAFTKENYSDQQKKYVEQYGSPYVKEFYNPHLTLAGPDVNEEKFLDIINSNNRYSITFDVKKIDILRRTGDDWIIENIDKKE